MRQHHTSAPQRSSSLALVSQPYHCKMATSKSDVADKLEIAPLRTLDGKLLLSIVNSINLERGMR